MTATEKQAVQDALSLLSKMIASVPEKDAQAELLMPPAHIAPWAEQNYKPLVSVIKDLPFTEQEVKNVIAGIDNAIEKDSRLAGSFDIATQVLTSLRGFLPLVAALL